MGNKLESKAGQDFLDQSPREEGFSSEAFFSLGDSRRIDRKRYEKQRGIP